MNPNVLTLLALCVVGGAAAWASPGRRWREVYAWLALLALAATMSLSAEWIWTHVLPPPGQLVYAWLQKLLGLASGYSAGLGLVQATTPASALRRLAAVALFLISAAVALSSAGVLFDY